LTAILAIHGADGTIRAYTEAGALPLPLLDIARPSTHAAVIWTEGRAWTRIVPQNVGTAPDLESWLTELVDYDDPIQTVKIGRTGITAHLFMVP